ncbi:MAG: tol-pal system-associated acyl-CoA thioesterase [Alphaproteobacteria bacterium]|nr:tol-pal system-associated acyl-CoA thioesterase [Alphaproteobacteria bacterium]
MVDPAWSDAVPASGRLVAGEFRFPIRVYYEDTDAGGIVYHANYLRFAERARTEMLRYLGIDQGRLRAEHGLSFVVRRCGIEFHAPARLDDHLEVRTWFAALRGAAVEARQVVCNAADGALLVALDLTIALVNPAGRPARLPADMRAIFERATGSPATVTA